MPRAFAPSQHYDDFTLSSTQERSDFEDPNLIHEVQEPFPLKSTLPSQYRRSQQPPTKSDRPALPRNWSKKDANGLDALQRDFARNSGGEDDVTLSTDVATEVDEYLGPSSDKRRATKIYEDDSFIPGVGRGHQRAEGNGASSYSAHRDLLASSNLPIHPSPATAARHEQLRLSTLKPNHLPNRQRQTHLSSSEASDGEDSESGNETSSTSTTSYIMQPQGLMQSKAESTGNHHAFTATQQSQSPTSHRHDRPKLDARALDEMDRAVKKGRAVLRQEIPGDLSPVHSRQGTPGGKGPLRSKKEEHMAQERGSPSKRLDQHRQSYRQDAVGGSNGSSGSAAGTDTRKPSDGSSNGGKQAGTIGSTTGETLVEDGRRDYVHSAFGSLHNGERSPFMKLPSGQNMGRGILPDSAVYLPDVTGMTSALESPVKAILGVEHRQAKPEVVQIRHLQTSEARLDDFNELAYYVKSVEKNLDQTQKKVQQVEVTSKKCVKEVDALRNEWSSWRHTKGKEPVRQEEEVDDELLEEDGENYNGKVKAINDHIAQLTRDLHSHRRTMEQMRAAKMEKEQAHLRRVQEKQQRQTEKKRLAALHQNIAPMSSSPVKQSYLEEEDEATRLEMIALRKQVNKVAKEVERLRSIVDGEGANGKGPLMEAKSARFANSLPAMRRDIGVGSQSPFSRPRMNVKRRSSSLEKGYREARFISDYDDMQERRSSPPPSDRRFDVDVENVHDVDIDGDETARPVEEVEEDDEDDVSMLAQTRAEKTFEVIEENGRGHDERSCTVCSSQQSKAKRREARRERVSQQARLPHFDDQEDDEEHVLMSLLDDAANHDTPLALPKNAKHQATLQRLLKEHMDEFYHHRMLYCELADELKQINPDMTRVKRRILAEHVMEAVEGLEFRARRINVLQGLTGSSLLDVSDNERRSKNKEKKRRPRNSPLIVDGGDLYRRVVSA